MTFAAAGRDNCVQVGTGVSAASYVWATTGAGSFVLPARCAHRGGPMHLATVDDRGVRLVCPWHCGGSSLTRLRKHGIPAVRTGGTVTAVLPHPADAEHRLEHRPLSPALTKGLCA